MGKNITWFTIGSILNIEVISDNNAECNKKKALVKVKHLGGHEQVYLYTDLSRLKATNNDVISFFFVAGDNGYEMLEIM